MNATSNLAKPAAPGNGLTLTAAPARSRALALSLTEEPVRSRPLRSGVFGALDIGTHKITCLIGRSDGSQLRVIGFDQRHARGIRLGAIVDLEDAERAIRAAVGRAEDMADHRLRSVIVNLACGQPESRLFNVRWPVGGRAVTDADVRRLVHEGRLRANSDGREVIHAMPLGFSVDETTGVDDPRGQVCEALNGRLHMIDASSSALRNLATVIERCDLSLGELVSAPLASGLSVLVDDERMLGATVIDMGAGTTQIATFGEGRLLHAAQLPVGGLHVTKDIASVLSTPLASAERLKAIYGNVEPSADDEREMLDVQMIGEEEHQFVSVPRSMLVGVIRPRMEETFEFVRDRLETAGLGRAANGRVVLTGGGSQLGGVRDLASSILGRPVRFGRPVGLVKTMPRESQGPEFATAYGLLAWATGAGRPFNDIDLSEPRPAGIVRRVVEFLRDRV
jgi:cell division protein FtsA